MSGTVSPLVARPPRWGVILLAVVLVLGPSRRGSLLLTEALQAGLRSRTAVAWAALAASGLVLCALWARSRLVLREEQPGRLVLDRRGLVRRRVHVLGEGDRALVVGGTLRRTLLLDRDGSLVATVGAFPDFWRRSDVVALLDRAGVGLHLETRYRTAGALEAAHPGSTAWVERSRLRLYATALPLTLALIAVPVWFLAG